MVNQKSAQAKSALPNALCRSKLLASIEWEEKGINMLYQVSAIAILITFYGFYIAKIIVQNKQSIKTNQMGTGNKSKKVLQIEKIMGLATVLIIIADVCSIFAVKKFPIVQVRIAGIMLGILAVVFFGSATITMKNSWRVGIPEEKTALVTNGIYKWSRNPAFVGFDLLYVSLCLLFFNIPLLVISIWAAVMLHLQVLQEEEHMKKTFGEDYIHYMKHTFRYFGKR